MSYHYFAIEERCCLREYYKKRYSYRKIVELLEQISCTPSPFENLVFMAFFMKFCF